MAASCVASPQVPARFAVGIACRTPPPQNANFVGDLDKLIKPTLDALEGICVPGLWKGPAQAADDRIDHPTASKRTVADGEPSGPPSRSICSSLKM